MFLIVSIYADLEAPFSFMKKGISQIIMEMRILQKNLEAL